MSQKVTVKVPSDQSRMKYLTRRTMDRPVKLGNPIGSVYVSNVGF